MAERESASTRVFRELENRINNNVYKYGERLPTEMEMTREFGLSRSTIRESITMLQTKGYVEVVRGSGTYVVNNRPENADNAWNLNNREKLQDYMTVRISIETLAVRLFIQHIDDKKVKTLRKCEELFEKSVREGIVHDMSKYDENFHSLIIAGAENELLADIGKTLAKAFRHYRDVTFENEDTRDEAVKAHRQILACIIRRDTDEAILAIREHLITSSENAMK